MAIGTPGGRCQTRGAAGQNARWRLPSMNRQHREPPRRRRLLCPGGGSVRRMKEPLRVERRNGSCLTGRRVVGLHHQLKPTHAPAPRTCSIENSWRLAVQAKQASGSTIGFPSRHAVLSDPGELVGDTRPNCATDDTGLRLFRTRSALPSCSHHPLQVGPSISGLLWFTVATACRVASLLGEGGHPRARP